MHPIANCRLSAQERYYGKLKLSLSQHQIELLGDLVQRTGSARIAIRFRNAKEQMRIR